MGRFAYGGGLAVAAVAVVLVDARGRSEDAGQATLLLLLMAAAVLGFAAPRVAWLAGLVLGCALPVAGIGWNLLRPDWAHVPDPPGMAGAATLFVLIVPAALAAWAGAGVRLALRRRTVPH
jgi:hypothetical protein